MVVKARMAVSTKRDEIVFFVVSQPPSKPNMMYLKVLKATTMLAAPTITMQYPLP
jgi:hypothetical protein